MSKISFNELQYIEKMLEMDGGYVLNFSNSTFQRFIFDSLEIDIYKKYVGLSKAKILRRIIDENDDVPVGKLFLQLLEYKKLHLVIKEDEKELFFKCVEISYRLIGKSTLPKVKSAPIVQRLNFDFDASYKSYTKMVTNKNAQERGYEFEKYLFELFIQNNLEPRESFRIHGEQIDGSFCLANEVYLLEAKWQSTPSNKNDLVIFNEKVSSKSAFTRGFFISHAGYSPHAVETFNSGRTVHIVLMDGQELAIILERKIDFKTALEKKIRCLAEEGNCYKNINELF
ncbi:restriction endonuclease [Paenibacillus agricola]|uniref:Restriction endonuclease n=1 Tax=Paenibacillus agricola TaxID=2716264 RepID=A0ABX0JHF2_9BACL|nr:restriction endonuclease [Paenibacillus agricola]NHN34681.1 restriction endonuclease [Paenibacillus agricola]